MLNSYISNQKHKNVKNMILNRLKKLLVYSIKGKTKRQSIILCDLSWEHAQQMTHFFFAILHMSANDPKSTAATDFRVINTF